MLAAQNHGCAVCLTKAAQLHLDHDHSTGTARAYLCPECNKALGLLTESPVRIRALATYIESFQLP
jgi:protein-arginine kinase activator protein McsA